MSTAATTGATVAAAAVARMMQEEEESMTPYAARELADDWEFKIIRSSMGSFRNPERLRAILEDEARAGWVLVEKFDSSRIRLKRSAAAKNVDGKLDFDPYRTEIGNQEAVVVLAIVGGVSVLLLGLLLLIVLTK